MISPAIAPTTGPASRTGAGTRRRGSRARRAARRRWRRRAHRLELGEHVLDRRDGDLGVHRRANGERPRAAAHVEPGARAVGVALLLAQLAVQAGVEQPTEDRAHHRDGVEVRDRPRQPTCPTRISVWTEPGRWMTRTIRAGRPPTRASMGRRRRRDCAAQAPKRVRRWPERPRRGRGRRRRSASSGRVERAGVDARAARRRRARATVSSVPPEGRPYGEPGA